MNSADQLHQPIEETLSFKPPNCCGTQYIVLSRPIQVWILCIMKGKTVHQFHSLCGSHIREADLLRGWGSFCKCVFSEITTASQRIPAAADVHNISRRLSTGWHLPSPALERNTHTVLLHPVHPCCAEQSSIVESLLRKHLLQDFDQFGASMKAFNCIEGCEAAESA